MHYLKHGFLGPVGLAGLIWLAGCAQDRGPIMGEWAGTTPGSSIDARKRVDLVLYGEANAQSGHYSISSTESDPTVTSSHGERRWGGTWERGHRTVQGHEVTTITLKDHLPEDVGAYALEADNMLHILDPSGLPDTTPDGRLYTISPVGPGRR